MLQMIQKTKTILSIADTKIIQKFNIRLETFFLLFTAFYWNVTICDGFVLQHLLLFHNTSKFHFCKYFIGGKQWMSAL